MPSKFSEMLLKIACIYHSVRDDHSRSIDVTWKQSMRMTRVELQRLVSLHRRQVVHRQQKLQKYIVLGATCLEKTTRQRT